MKKLLKYTFWIIVTILCIRTVTEAWPYITKVLSAAKDKAKKIIDGIQE